MIGSIPSSSPSSQFTSSGNMTFKNGEVIFKICEKNGNGLGKIERAMTVIQGSDTELTLSER